MGAETKDCTCVGGGVCVCVCVGGGGGVRGLRNQHWADGPSFCPGQQEAARYPGGICM